MINGLLEDKGRTWKHSINKEVKKKLKIFILKTSFAVNFLKELGR
jgi:hypothetical protein